MFIPTLPTIFDIVVDTDVTFLQNSSDLQYQRRCRLRMVVDRSCRRSLVVFFGWQRSCLIGKRK